MISGLIGTSLAAGKAAVIIIWRKIATWCPGRTRQPSADSSTDTSPRSARQIPDIWKLAVIR
jgi:hypothetical protein